MSVKTTFGNTTLRLTKGDITLEPVEAIVFYAREDLELGSGFGNAIAVRGGPGIKKELAAFDRQKVGDVVVTGAGDLTANYILHAVGPKFQEHGLEEKLRTVIKKSLLAAEALGVKSLAFPPMGAGFYGVPLPLSAGIMKKAFSEHFTGKSEIQELVICLLSNRDYSPFAKEFSSAQATGK